MAEYIYIIKTIEDNKIQLATKVDIFDGVMMSENKICAVLKRYELPVDMSEVVNDLGRFSTGVPAAAQTETPLAPAPKMPVQTENTPEPVSEPVSQQEAEICPVIVDRHLCDYKKEPSTYCGYTPLYMNPDDSRLDELGKVFFQDCDQVLVGEPGNTPRQRMEAIRRFGMFLESMRSINRGASRNRFLDNTEAYNRQNRVMVYRYDFSPGGSYYDGGCHTSDSDTDYDAIIDRITREEFERGWKRCAQLQSHSPDHWYYYADLPGEAETEAFHFYCADLYMKDPMGILGYYRLHLWAH